MEKQVKISKIKLSIGGKDIELTLEQAKELRNELLALWPEPRQVDTVPIYLPPVVIEKTERPYWESPWMTWCEAGSDTLCMAVR